MHDLLSSLLDRFDHLFAWLLAALGGAPLIVLGTIRATRRNPAEEAVQAPPPEVPPPAGPLAKFRVVEILYGTDRAPAADAPGGYSGERGGRLRFGAASVSVPRRRRIGSVQRPLRLFSLGREDPDRHFVLRGCTELIPGEFRARLDDAARAAPDAPALLFVHGYHTGFDGGLYRTAQLAIDLQVAGPVLHYSWPSRGQLLEYNYDRDSALTARTWFRTFLDVVAQTSVRSLNIVAHSKGAELVLEALADHPRTRLRKVRQVVLASPDVATSQAEQLIPGVSRKVAGMTLYACKEDLALSVSRLNAGRQPRAGGLLADGYPLIAAGLDSIDASKCRLRLTEFNHNSVVVDTVLRHDLGALLATGVRPPHRRSASITPETCPRGPYWRLQPR